MGNEQLCRVQCTKVDQRQIHAFQESACIQMVDNLPTVNGRLNFSKQASFNKVQRAASQYCATNLIDRNHVPIIARLIAYQQNHYFQAIKQLQPDARESFVLDQEEIDIELMDSLYHYFVVKQKGQINPQMFLGNLDIITPPLINISEIKRENLGELCGVGLDKLRKGKVALVLMLAGSSEDHQRSSKALARLPILGHPTVLQLLMRRYASYLKVEGSIIAGSRSLLKEKRIRQTPLIVICSAGNYSEVKSIFEKNDFFGLEKNFVKIVLENRSVPLIGIDGKLCLSANRRTLSKPAGTAIAVSKIIATTLKDFLENASVQYVHFMGCDNLNEIPCDPVMVGLMERFGRQVASKCVDGLNTDQTYPRYVATKAAFHLLDSKELNMLNSKVLEESAPVALNSMIFRLDSLIGFYHNFETTLYIAKRFHMKEVQVDHYDFQKQAQIRNARVFSFEQDIRDYVSASPQAIVVKYKKHHFRVVNPSQISQAREPIAEPTFY